MSEVQPDLPDLSRHVIEAEIERMISILDWLDDDPDLEPQGEEEPTEDTEPLYGWTGMEAAYGRYSLEYNGQGADELELDEADSEPSLGSSHAVRQLHWASGSRDEREEVCEDEGAQCDDEGCVETDCGFDEDDPGYEPQWGAGPEEQEATTRACVGAISRVRHLQQQRGQKPVEPLRVLSGAIIAKW